jgi:hypothetical protein
MNRRAFLRSTSAAVGAAALEGALTFRRPKVILPVPTPSAQYQKGFQPGV